MPSQAATLRFSMELRTISAQDTWPLRLAILRPHGTLKEVDFAHDTDPGTFHLGALRGNACIGVASFYQEAHPELSNTIDYRLRGMAVATEFQGTGVGNALMQEAWLQLKQRDAGGLWCNARHVALAFYAKQGMRIHGEAFDIPGIGEHFLMYRSL